MRAGVVPSLALGLCLGLAPTAGAVPVGYTDSVSFLDALTGPPITAGFDGLASGQVIPSGATADGITFTYDFGGIELLVTDGTAAGGGGPFDTTSAPNFLGSADLDLLQDGDDLVLGFAAASAIGLFIITAEAPGVTIFDGDIGLGAGGGTVLLDVEALEQTLPDGSLVFFLGLIDPKASFTTASLDTFGGGGAFFFNVDDVVIGVPEPGVATLLGLFLGAFGAVRRGRRRASPNHGKGIPA